MNIIICIIITLASIYMIYHTIIFIIYFYYLFIYLFVLLLHILLFFQIIKKHVIQMSIYRFDLTGQ